MAGRTGHKCQLCGASFPGHRRKYCSPKCRNRAQYERAVSKGGGWQKVESKPCMYCGTVIENPGNERQCDECRGYVSGVSGPPCPWCGSKRAWTGKGNAKNAVEQPCSDLCREALDDFLTFGPMWSDVRSRPLGFIGPPVPGWKCRWCLGNFLYCDCKQHWVDWSVRVRYVHCEDCGLFMVRRGNQGDVCSRCQKRRYRRRHRPYEKYRKEVYDRDGLICWICKEPCDPDDFTIDENGHYHSGPLHPSLDHIIKRAFGGPDTPDNLRTAHQSCNSDREDWSKGAQLAFC